MVSLFQELLFQFFVSPHGTEVPQGSTNYLLMFTVTFYRKRQLFFLITIVNFYLGFLTSWFRLLCVGKPSVAVAVSVL